MSRPKALHTGEFSVLNRALFNTFAFSEAETDRLVQLADENPKLGRALLAVAELDDEAGLVTLAKSLLNAAHVR